MMAGKNCAKASHRFDNSTYGFRRRHTPRREVEEASSLIELTTIIRTFLRR